MVSTPIAKFPTCMALIADKLFNNGSMTAESFVIGTLYFTLATMLLINYGSTVALQLM